MIEEKRVSSLKKNTYFIFTGQAIQMVLSFILVPIAARFLGEDGFGKYSLGMTISYFVLMINDLGINTYITREIAKKNDELNTYYANAFILKIFSITLVAIFLLVFLKLSNYASDTKYIILILSVYGVLSSMVQLITGTFRASEKMEYDMIIVALEKAITTGIGIFILTKGLGLISFASTFILGGCISIILGFYILKKKIVSIHFSFNRQFATTILVNSLPFGASMFLIQIYDKIDTVMLSFMKTMSDVGWYSSAYRLLSISSVIPTILVTAIFPKLSKDIFSEKNDVAVLFTRCFRYLFFLSAPFIVIGVLLGDKIILLIFGEQYEQSIAIFQILVWAEAIIFLNILLGTLFRASDHQKTLVIFQLLGAATNVTLNFILIPIYSYIGAAIATVVTEGILFFVYLNFASKRICKLQETKFIFQSLFSAMVLASAIYFMRYLNLFILLIVAGIVYFGLLYLMKAFTLQEIFLIRKKT